MQWRSQPGKFAIVMVFTCMYHQDAVSPKKPYTLKIDPELLEALREIKERDGIPESEQIRRGIQLWLDSKGYTSSRRAARQTAGPRKRA
jgi:hypothetical protein